MNGALWNRYAKAIGDESLPLALVDLDALEANVRTLARPLKAAGKRLRIATKSIRAEKLLRRIEEHATGISLGLMTYTAGETVFLAQRGYKDLLLAYPTARKGDADLLALANKGDATAAVVVDDVGHLELLDARAREAGTVIPVVVDADMGYRPISKLKLGVERSPLSSAEEVVELARATRHFRSLRFHGVMGYEAQIAGVADSDPATRLMKRLSGRDVVKRRAELKRQLLAAGFAVELFNGGGTGTVHACASEAVLTEVTVGSGFLDSHLFDGYDALDLTPAAYFALQVVRRPASNIVTCHGGGYVASGGAGRDRLPLPVAPEGLSLRKLEGAGEVQTPLHVKPGVHLELGDPVFFRHAKAGELAEHFNEYLLVRGDEVVGRVPTYRGEGRHFLG